MNHGQESRENLQPANQNRWNEAELLRDLSLIHI